MLDGNVELPPLRYQAHDPTSMWAKSRRNLDNHLPVSLKRASIGRQRYSYFDDEDLPPSSEMDVDGVDVGLPELDSETTGESTPGHDIPSLSFSDSESDQHISPNPSPMDEEVPTAAQAQDDDEDFGYGHGGWRATFFTVSEERGRWKDDPIALKSTTTSGLRRKRLSRQSMPALASSSTSSDAPPSITTRTISEPLASSSRLSQKPRDISTHEDDCDDLPDTCEVNMCEGHAEVLGGQGVNGGPQDFTQDGDTLPSSLSPLVTSPSLANSRHASGAPSVDREAPSPTRDHTQEVEEAPEPSAEVAAVTNYIHSSPLPPSSPPLSPMSGCVYTLSRSVSPLSFLSSSPASSVRGLDLDVDDDVDIDQLEEAQKLSVADDDGDDDRVSPVLHSIPRKPNMLVSSSYLLSPLPHLRQS